MTSAHPLDRLRVGMRAVVRHRLDDGLSDALGEVVALDETSVSVATRRGVRVVHRAAVVAAKEVPPAPARRGAPHLALSMADLQRVMVEGWPPTERAALGGWMLRAAGGFTGRANSVLPLGDPGMPLPEAVQAAERWYAERQLRPMFTLFGPEGFAVDDDVLGTAADPARLHRRQPVRGDDDSGRVPAGRHARARALRRRYDAGGRARGKRALAAVVGRQRRPAPPLPGHRGGDHDRLTGPGVPLGGDRRADRRDRPGRLRPRLGRRLRRPRRARLPAAGAGHRPHGCGRGAARGRAGSPRCTCRWRRSTRPPSASTATSAA